MKENKHSLMPDRQLVPDQALSDIFHAAGVTPNTIPVEELMKRKKSLLGSLRIAQLIAGIAFVLFLLIPLIFRYAAGEMKTPAIASSYREDGKLWITLTEDSRGVDFDSCYAMTDQGLTLKPVSTDPKSGVIVFDVGEDSLNIYIVNYAGDQTHAVYTSFD